MPGIALVGVDRAGGINLGGGNVTWTWNGSPISVLGDRIAGHGEHLPTTMITASTWFTINGLGVVRAGDRAGCGHSSTGQTNFVIE